VKFQRSRCSLGAKIRPDISRGSYMNLPGLIFIYAVKQIYPTSPENQERMLRHNFTQYNGMIPE